MARLLTPIFGDLTGGISSRDDNSDDDTYTVDSGNTAPAGSLP